MKKFEEIPPFKKGVAIMLLLIILVCFVLAFYSITNQDNWITIIECSTGNHTIYGKDVDMGTINYLCPEINKVDYFNMVNNYNKINLSK